MGRLAVFGLGDSSYPSFCGVVHQFEDVLKEKGKTLFGESLKIDGYPEGEVMDHATSWAEKLVA